MANAIKFCLYCPESCKIEGEHHHYPGTNFDRHPGNLIPAELGGMKRVEQE